MRTRCKQSPLGPLARLLLSLLGCWLALATSSSGARQSPAQMGPRQQDVQQMQHDLHRSWPAARHLSAAPQRLRMRSPSSSMSSMSPPNGRGHVIEDFSAALRARQLAESLELQQSGGRNSVAASATDVETFYIRKGANGTLLCSPISPGDSQAAMGKIEWFKEEKKLLEAESKRIVVWNTKNSIAYLPESGALFFRGVASEDSGEYHCQVTRAGGEIEDGMVRFYVQDVPDAPQMPIVTSFTQRSVNISWVPSYDYHHSPILHYVIHVREGVEGQWDVGNGIMTPDNRTQFEIIGLKPFTTYSFRVLAVNAIGVGEPSPASHYIITLRQKPDSRLTILSARNISSNAIRLEWLPPLRSEIHGEFLGYRIRYVAQLHEHAPPAEPGAGLGDFGATAAAAQAAGASVAVYQAPGRPGSASARPILQPSLDGPLAKQIIVGDPSQTSFVIKNLNPFTPYRISVQVSNPAGDGPVAEVLATTDEGVPSPPRNLSVLKILDTQVKLRWQEPEAPNGILQGYQISLHDIDAATTNDSRRLADSQSQLEHTLAELAPYTWYKAHVMAYSRKYLGEPSQPVKFQTDVSAPSAPQLINVTCFSPDSIMIQWQRPDKFYKRLDFYYVQYRLESADEPEETALAANKDKLLNELLITKLSADQRYELKVLAATKSILDQHLVYRSEPSQAFRVVLQANCESYTAYPVTESTFNMSLAIGVVCASFALALVTASLVVWRRHCQAAYYYLDDPQTASRGTNSPQLSETFDDTEYGSIVVNDWAKHVQRLHVDGDIGFSREFEQIQQANQNANLTYEHSQLPENKHKNRYINIVAYDHTRVTLRQLPGQKKPGNDYINANFIDGYNKPRAYIGTQGPLVSTFDDYWRMIWEQKVVIIVMITNLQERGRRKCDMYWPKEGSETYGNIQVKLLQEVVMATYTLRTFTARNLKLKKRNGCERTVYQYHYTNWPDHGVPDHPLPVLSFVRKSASANPPGAGAIICHCSAGCGRSGTYIVIDAMLKQIRHRQSINVVDFLKHIRSQRNYLVQTEEQYIFIHDALVEAIESGETEIASNLIAKYIQLLQTGGSNQTTVAISQKNSSYSITNGLGAQAIPLSVQASTKDLVNSQSNLLLSATNGNSNSNTSGLSNNNKQANNNTTTITSRSQSVAGSGGQWSLLERQYRLVASFKAKDFNVVSALKPCNKNKNRTLNLIPLEAHRVHITPKPGADGSDYINATFLMGFNHLKEFIVTQHPVHDTFSDFWQMVYDHNSQTIVLLTQMNDPKEFSQFWPQKEDEVDYGSFKVKLTQESTVMKPDSGGTIVTRDFIMRSNQDDYELQTRIIHCPGWPESCGPLSGVFELIQVVQNATQQQASQQRMHDGLTTTTTVTIGQEHEPQNGGPIIVVDKFGGTEAATFAVLTTLFKQINFEDAVDVYMYAKLAHLRRPGIWSSQDDYLFLYRAIENYASILAEQQANQNSSAPNSALSSPAINFHHQTMTLDRHKHKSQASAFKTSTMRRGQTGAGTLGILGRGPGAAGLAKDMAQTSLSQTTMMSQLSKSNNQLVLDQNHNQIPVPVSGPGGLLVQPSDIMVQRPRPINQLKPMMNNMNNNNSVAPNLMMGVQVSNINNVSPYNSAMNIGTSPHQHLLAGNTGARAIGPGQDHYLYPMS